MTPNDRLKIKVATDVFFEHVGFEREEIGIRKGSVGATQFLDSVRIYLFYAVIPPRGQCEAAMRIARVYGRLAYYLLLDREAFRESVGARFAEEIAKTN